MPELLHHSNRQRPVGPFQQNVLYPNGVIGPSVVELRVDIAYEMSRRFELSSAKFNGAPSPHRWQHLSRK